jgi:hypothetical protein
MNKTKRIHSSYSSEASSLQPAASATEALLGIAYSAMNGPYLATLARAAGEAHGTGAEEAAQKAGLAGDREEGGAREAAAGGLGTGLQLLGLGLRILPQSALAIKPTDSGFELCWKCRKSHASQ